MCAFCMYICSYICTLDAYTARSIIYSSLSELNDAYHTNEMVVYHELRLGQCDHTPQPRFDLMFDQRSRADAESDFVKTISSKIGLSLLSLSSDLSVSIVAVLIVLVHKVTYKV